MDHLQKWETVNEEEKSQPGLIGGQVFVESNFTNTSEAVYHVNGIGGSNVTVREMLCTGPTKELLYSVQYSPLYDSHSYSLEYCALLLSDAVLPITSGQFRLQSTCPFFSKSHPESESVVLLNGVMAFPAFVGSTQQTLHLAENGSFT